jgi:predicted regulator of Ras-like GTPase activity (Roadblock/LC7/MglB family)
MSTLPQLIEEDIHLIDGALDGLLTRSEAAAALLMDKAGFLITHRGDTAQFDATTLGALAAGSFNANEAIANLINEPNFKNVIQQGETFSMFVCAVDEFCLLLVLFKVDVSVGAVKYCAQAVIPVLAAQLKKAKEREPGAGLDLAMANLADPSSLFKKKV